LKTSKKDMKNVEWDKVNSQETQNSAGRKNLKVEKKLDIQI
jgi:hypothetical protein